MTINLPGGIKSISLATPPNTFGSNPIITRNAPGSAKVYDRELNAVRYCDDKLCPFAEYGKNGNKLINRAPFFGTGGWAFVIRGSADEKAKQTMFEFIEYVNNPEQSTLDVAFGTPFDAFRSSHLSADSVFLSKGWNSARLEELKSITKYALDHSNCALDFSFPGEAELSVAFKTNLRKYFYSGLILFLFLRKYNNNNIIDLIILLLFY